MVGISIHWAPSLVSFDTRLLACARALVITIRFPNRGLLSNHASSSLRDTTLPITIMAGDLSLAFLTFSTIVSRVPVTVFCLAVVPHLTRATGVSGDLPLVIRFFAIFSRFFTHIKNTRVALDLAYISHCIRVSFLSGFS